MRSRSRWSPRPLTLLLALGAFGATLAVRNQETEKPLLASENAPGPKKWAPAQPVEREGLAPESLFEGSGKNPGSAAHANAPGRVRPDAPAWFEINHLDPKTPEWLSYMLQPRQPENFAPPDPRFKDVIRMSDDTRADDYPSIVTHPNDPDDVWMIYVSYSGQRDELRLARRDAKTGTWGPWNPVPGVTGDVWRPSLAFDRSNRLWVVWAQQEPFEANFDLYARWFDGEHWGRLERLSSAAEGDFDQQVARGSDGTLHLTWQGFRDGQSDIFYTTYDGERWARERKLSDSLANDWAPAVAVDSKGNAYVIWDTYDRGDYDVVGKVVRADGEAGQLVTVSASDFFEARATVAVDAEDRVWVAYEVGDKGWGKDTGMLIDEERQPGAMLNDERSVQVRIRTSDHSWVAAQPELGTLFPPRNELPYTTTKNPSLSAPVLAVDGDGRVHLAVRKLESPGARVQYWQPYVTTMSGAGWSQPVAVPYASGRLSMNVSAAPAKNGGLWLTWPRDNWPTFATAITFPEETVEENVYAGRFEPDVEAGIKTGPPVAPPFPDRAPGHDDEAADVARVRAWRTRVDGKELQILRGDTHRHTELSLDVRGTPDGSILDFYRYMLDAAAMDFGLISDHQNGAEREYWWWLEEKLADLFHAPERYVAMFGFERSIQYPYGHRNVVRAERGWPVIPFYGKTSYAGSEFPNIRYHNGTGTVQEDDTKMLYEEVRRSGGITIPHTSATTMGTDWRDNDPEIEPLVEIFQGDRFSAEMPDAPLTDTGDVPQQAITERRPAGYVSNALAKGYKLGFIASSDHLSTHLSYAMVWAADRSREAVLEAMKARRTYAATDNIVLEFWVGDHFMGEQVAARDGGVPEIRVKAVGTREIANAEILRNSKSVYKSAPGKKEVEIRFRDLEPVAGTSYYYVRVSQIDGQTAWSSPIWVDRGAANGATTSTGD